MKKAVPAKWRVGRYLVIIFLACIFVWFFELGANFLAIEVFAVVLALFIFGSTRFRIDKNSITYGALPIIFATFFFNWWAAAPFREEIVTRGVKALWEAVQRNLLSIHGLEKLLHGDTMLFILGLTFLVGVVSQARLLETISMHILRVFNGRVLPTILSIAAFVSLASGIFDGVSMIGLTIRIFLIILIMGKISHEGMKFIVMVSVILTTVAGIWLAYGEPPNLIMKSNLGLPDKFFLSYAMPLALLAFIITSLYIRRFLHGAVIPLKTMDILERNSANVQFLQVSRYGRVMDGEEMLREYAFRFGAKAELVHSFYHKGHHPISSMLKAGIPQKIVYSFITEYLGKEFIKPVFSYYHHRIRREDSKELRREIIEGAVIMNLLEDTKLQARSAQFWAIIAFIPFAGLLIWHARDNTFPLFLSSFAGFAVAFLGILPYQKMRILVLREALREYKEYLFLFPLFLSITMLTQLGFFDQLKIALERGVHILGPSYIAIIQFLGSGLLSAILDNNVVADFASRAIEGTEHLFLFAAAQIAGYATGGSLTHIGSAQSLIAFAYIVRYIEPHFTPLDWVRAMWRIIFTITIVLGGALYIFSFF